LEICQNTNSDEIVPLIELTPPEYGYEDYGYLCLFQGVSECIMFPKTWQFNGKSTKYTAPPCGVHNIKWKV
jgi:hypothetical protein